MQHPSENGEDSFYYQYLFARYISIGAVTFSWHLIAPKQNVFFVGSGGALTAPFLVVGVPGINGHLRRAADSNFQALPILSRCWRYSEDDILFALPSRQYSVLNVYSLELFEAPCPVGFWKQIRVRITNMPLNIFSALLPYNNNRREHLLRSPTLTAPTHIRHCTPPHDCIESAATLSFWHAL